MPTQDTTRTTTYDSPTTALGRALDERKRARRWTLAETGEHLGVSRERARQMIYGETPIITPRLADALSRSLGETIAFWTALGRSA